MNEREQERNKTKKEGYKEMKSKKDWEECRRKVVKKINVLGMPRPFIQASAC
jgi:hypothetical protein